MISPGKNKAGTIVVRFLVQN